MSLYSQAPRCEHCNMKPLLDDMAALALVDSAAPGKLEAFQCPLGDGWHVRRPDLDREPRR